MTKFNKGSSLSLSTKTVNLAGGVAFKESPKVELTLLLLTSFMEDQYYMTKEEKQKCLLDLMQQVEPSFSAKGALYARHKFGMRSISHIIAGELARFQKVDFSKKKFFEDIVVRPDDMLEIATYYLQKYGKPLPNSMKRGFASAFNKFGDYEIAKYKKSNLPFKLIDLINLVHPVPTSQNCKAIEALVKGEKLPSETWETLLTQAGQKANEENREELKREAWLSYLNSDKVTYFALLRNLRNILNLIKDKEVLQKVANIIVDEKRIKGSRLFPYRFLSAYKEITRCNEPNARIILPAIAQALDIACKNCILPEGDTLVIVDVSGSMRNPLSSHSSVELIDVAGLMGLMLWRVGADMILFADRAKYFSGDPHVPILAQMERIRGANLGGGTRLTAGLEKIQKHYDRVIIISDMQSWMETHYAWGKPVIQTWHDITSKFGSMKLYSWDLAGYGSLQFPEKDVYLLGGFSEKVFDLMGYLEKGPEALIKEIENFTPRSEERDTSNTGRGVTTSPLEF